MFHFKMDKKKQVKIKDVFRVEFSGKRKPALICASSFGEAANIASRLTLHDEGSTSVISILWLDPIAVFE